MIIALAAALAGVALLALAAALGRSAKLGDRQLPRTPREAASLAAELEQGGPPPPPFPGPLEPPRPPTRRRYV